jgi:hypothetical protein
MTKRSRVHKYEQFPFKQEPQDGDFYQTIATF